MWFRTLEFIYRGGWSDPGRVFKRLWLLFLDSTMEHRISMFIGLSSLQLFAPYLESTRIQRLCEHPYATMQWCINLGQKHEDLQALDGQRF